MIININAVGFSADEKLENYIYEKMKKLTKYNNRIISSDIYLRLENSGQIKDKVLEIKTHLPGNTLFVSDTQKSFEAAFDKALDGLKRQIKKYNEKLKAH